MISWAMCDCLKNPLSIINAFKNTINAASKFLWYQKQPEKSELMFAIGRLVGSIKNKPYARILGDEIALERYRDNMKRDGCATGCCHKSKSIISMEGKNGKKI
jgi:hypothetical protein